MFKKLNKLFYFTAYTTLLCGLIAGGVYLAILKNKHTLVQREIHKVEQRTRSKQNLLSHYKADLLNSSNRFLLKQKIESYHTGLIPIKSEDIIKISASSKSRIAQSE